jgi:hypothetical protein
MFVRMARFEGGTAEGIDEEIRSVRQSLAHSDQLPAGLRAVKRVVTLVDRAGGTGIELVFCETEADLQAADAALDAMSPSSEASGQRASVEMFEVALDERPQ